MYNPVKKVDYSKVNSFKGVNCKNVDYTNKEVIQRLLNAKWDRELVLLSKKVDTSKLSIPFDF